MPPPLSLVQVYHAVRRLLIPAAAGLHNAPYFALIFQ